MPDSLEDIVAHILVRVDRGQSIHYLMDDLRNAYNDRLNTVDLERVFLDSLYEAAEESEWIPPEYYANDWISDACEFLRTGNGVVHATT